MNTLQLAENGYSLADAGLLSEFDIMEHYINVPTENGDVIRVREDYFDNYSNAEFNELMNYLEPYQETTMSGLFSGIRERITARREDRRERKGKTIDPETGLTQRQSYKLQRQAKRQEGLGNILGKVTDIFKKPEPTSDELKSFQYSGGVDFGGGSQPQNNTGKTLLIVGGIGLAAFLIYKMAKGKKK